MSKWTIPLCGTVLLLILGSIPATKANTPTNQYEESPLEITEPTPTELHLEKLAFQESSGRENIVILDTNGKHSYGCLQFQKATWEEQKRIHNLEADIMDCLAQKELAKRMLLANRNNWRHWKNSHLKIGLPPLPEQG